MKDKFPFPPTHKQFSLGQGVVIFLLLFILLGNVFYLGYKYNEAVILTSNDEKDSVRKLALVQNILNENFLYSDKVPHEQMFDGAVEGMASSLGDPYTRYISEREYQEFKIQTEGSFGGIGVSVDVSSDTDSGIIISNINEGEGADLAGLKPNDRIVKVDGEPIEGMNIEDAIALIRGDIGTDVQLEVIREGEKKPITVIIQRSEVELPSVEKQVLKDNIGYIRISRFSRNTSEKFATSFNELEKDGINKLVLDLRSNPGGLFNEASKIASFFLNEKEDVVIVNSKNYNYPVNSLKTDFTIDIPTIILVDEFSASASEVLAGALQSHNKAIILGNNTFGKGLIQKTIKVDEESALIVTVSEYLTPNEEKIHEKGILPDIEESNSAEDMLKGIDRQLDKAIRELNKKGGTKK